MATLNLIYKVGNTNFSTVKEILSANSTAVYTPTFSNHVSPTSYTSFELIYNSEIATPPSPAVFLSYPVPDFRLQKFDTIGILHFSTAIISKTETTALHLLVLPGEIDTNITTTLFPQFMISDIDTRLCHQRLHLKPVFIAHTGMNV